MQLARLVHGEPFQMPRPLHEQVDRVIGILQGYNESETPSWGPFSQ